MVKNRRLDLIFLSFGLAIATIFVDSTPSQAIALNRNNETETNSIVLQLELLKQKSQTAFDRVEQDISVVRKALGLPDIKELIPRSSNLPAYFSASQYQYQYQYQNSTDTISTVDRPAPQASEVLSNIGNAFSQLNFSRTVATTPQIQTLAQSSVETVDEGVYYYEGSLETRTAEEENIVNTILRNSQPESSQFNNLLPARSGVFARALTNEIAGTISFFSGIQRIRQVSNPVNYAESRQLQLGEIESVIRTTNTSFSTSNIQKSPYQLAIDQQNQRYLEQQEKQQEQLKKQLEREEEQRNREKEQIEKQRQDELEDAAKQRKDQLSQLQKNRQSQKRK
jgi:hypothetical protein